MKRDKKGSLTRELAVILVGLVAGTIMLCWFINTSFLEKYYMLNKQDSLIDGYDVINGASETGELNSSEFDVTFDNLCANGNIAVMIISSNRAIVRSSVNDNQVILMEFMNILFGDDRSQTEILQRSDNYVIQKQTDTRLSSEYMVLYGTLSNGNLILMRTAVESIRESAKISNQFLVYVGVLAIAISAIVTVFVSKRITTPISELTDISKRMTELDFDAKYVSRGHRKNEIDELGEHFNRLSCALESTISELKSANNELKQDIEKKTEIDEMRKEFLSNVSHELKTPLALIQGYAEGLQACINDDAQSRDFYCEVIMDEADKMNQMVKKLLTLNQLEFGNEVVPMERFNLTELIHGIINSSSILLEQNDISVISDEDARSLKSGDYVYITGTIYTARDAAHKRMAEALERKEQLPIDMKNNIIYYMGPSPAREQRPIGSAGPTTASRMDKYAPDLLDLGLKGMIGKGKRSKAVIDAIVRNGAVYFAAVGGAGAILSKCIKKSTVIAYDDLGTEAIRELEVENFPVVVVIDSEGNNLYETAIKEYRKE